MQQIQYFKSAWGDIKNSPGWFGKLCLLALVNLIPIFGQIVTLGYAYGWAREIAWGTHEPMPARIFANDDGKLYRRGWFILVLSFVAMLVPYIVMGIGGNMQGAGVWGVASGSRSVAGSIVSGLGLLVYLVGLVGMLLFVILSWIGAMRISIYDRLSAGFQIGKVWKMFRHDTGGIMRIFGMDLLVGLIAGIVVSIVMSIVMFFIVLAGVAGLAASGYSITALQHMTDSQVAAVVLQFIASAGVMGFFGILVVLYLAYVASMFVMVLVARAMGYWTMQFDVPRWRGQDDPMPFESVASTAGVPPASPSYAQQNPMQGAYGAQPAVQPMQQAQGEAPVVPAAVVTPQPYWQSSQEDEADAGEDAEALEDALDAGSEPKPVPAGEPSVDEQPGQPAVEPGQLSGFTYTGAAPMPQPPVSPSGADPSEATTPDLLVVVPETPADEEGSDER